MLTLKLITEQTERVIAGLEKKHFAGAREAIAEVMEIDKQRRAAQTQLDKNLADAKKLAAEIGALMKQGKKLQRKGWNGKQQYIELATNISYVNADNVIVNCEHDAIGNKAIAFVGTSGVQMGWLASQADMLAEDWKVVE